MKTLLYSCMMLLLVFSSDAKKDEEKRKVIEKTYPVNPSTKLDIDNQFGNVQIDNWSQNEFYVKVEIMAEGRSSERAQELLDKIKIDISNSESLVTFETKIERQQSKNDEGFKINYTVKMPAINPLVVRNKFGDTYLDDREGSLKLDVSYGSLRAGELADENDIELAYGNGSIESLMKGELDIEYSDFNLDKAGEIELDQSYSEVELGEIEEAEIDSRYGSLEIEKINKAEVDIRYSGFEIEELTGSLEMECSYMGGFEIEKVAKTFTLLDIEGDYSSYKIGLEEGLNAQIEAEFTYSKLDVDNDVKVDFSHEIKEKNRSYYKGKIGEGDPSKEIRIDSSYGSATIKYD